MRLFRFSSGQTDLDALDRRYVGGKGWSLARMAAAGLPVPPGFIISAEYCKQFVSGAAWPEGLKVAVRDEVAWLENETGRRFGSGGDPLLLAVRSGAEVSMPGMLDTILNVGRAGNSTVQEGEMHGGQPSDDPYEQLFAAIEAVFRSWDNARARRYRQERGLDGLLGTAVTVQAMVPAEVAGVLFTQNPVAPSAQQIVIEVVRGLGDTLVSGRVTPDRYIIGRKTGEVIEHQPSQPKSSAGEALLDSQQLRRLVELALRVEELFGTACDIEWAIAGGRVWLLQARPIGQRDDGESDEIETLRREEIARLRSLASPEGTVWSRYNLAEILPQPTPITWDIIRRFMSGRGGFGMMYRDLGFRPDPSLDDVCIYDLICNRPYCNLDREPKMQYGGLPFVHRFERLKERPELALHPVAVFDPSKAPWHFWLLLPVHFFRLLRGAVRLSHVQRAFESEFRQAIIPRFLEKAAAAEQTEWRDFDSSRLLTAFHQWIDWTFDDFARESLKGTAFAAMALNALERRLVQAIASRKPRSPQATDESQTIEQARALVQRLLVGVRPDPEADLGGALMQLANGSKSVEEFLRDFGHRGPEEMELSAPRWAERPESLMASVQSRRESPREFDTKVQDEVNNPVAEIADTLVLGSAERQQLSAEVERAAAFVRLRELGKHHLMRGVAIIRRLLVEIGARHELGDDVFYLTLDELPAVVRGEDLRNVAAARRRKRDLLLKIPVPSVVFSDDLEAIGRLVHEAGETSFRGTPLSPGYAEGKAVVLEEPGTVADIDGFILVCPTTDPAWMPLFVRARAIVMEAGGMLSHGAIVARELGLPAVAGIPGIHEKIRTGQRLAVDGRTGVVTVLAEPS